MTRNGSGKNGSGSARYRAKFVAPFSRQMRLLCGRLLRNMYRHPFLLKVHYTASFAVALAVGMIFWDVGSNQGGIQNRMGSLFFMLLYLTLMSLSSLPVWREDRLLFLRERANRVYGRDSQSFLHPFLSWHLSRCGCDPTEVLKLI